MRCNCCKDGNMENNTTTYFAQLENCYVIIENVPCLKCDQCGEVVFKVSIAEKLDGILDNLEKIVTKISIIDFTKVA